MKKLVLSCCQDQRDKLNVKEVDGLLQISIRGPITRHPDDIEIELTQAQVEDLQSFLNRWLSSPR